MVWPLSLRKKLEEQNIVILIDEETDAMDGSGSAVHIILSKYDELSYLNSEFLLELQCIIYLHNWNMAAI